MTESIAAAPRRSTYKRQVHPDLARCDQAHFARYEFEAFLPEWSAEDVRTAAADGKIPVSAIWHERLSGRDIRLDALMNLSSFEVLATDQKALADRIRFLI